MPATKQPQARLANLSCVTTHVGASIYAMRTKTDLIPEWSKWTGTPESETRHFVRVSSDAGILPFRLELLTTTHKAMFLLAALSPTHKESADLARKAGALRCLTAQRDLGIVGLDLLTVIERALRGEFIIIELQASIPINTVRLVISIDGILSNDMQCVTGKTSMCLFRDETELHLNSSIFPVSTIRSIGFPLIARLAQTVQNENADPVPAESAHIDSNPTGFPARQGDTPKRRKATDSKAKPQLVSESHGVPRKLRPRKEAPWPKSDLPLPRSA